MAESIGNLLDSLGVTHSPDEGEMTTDAVVLLKVVDMDGNVSMRLAWSEGMSWIERLGMLTAADHIERMDCGERGDDE